MDKDTAVNVLYYMVSAIGTLEQRMAMDVVVKELGYEQFDSAGLPVVIHE